MRAASTPSCDTSLPLRRPRTRGMTRVALRTARFEHEAIRQPPPQTHAHVLAEIGAEEVRQVMDRHDVRARCRKRDS